MSRVVSELKPERAQPCILVVEDELLIRLLISQELRDSGFRVIEVFSADEALRILQSGVAIDLIFTDVRLPGTIDGLALMAIVLKEFQTIEVVVTSAHLSADAVSCPFFTKPYRPIEVVATIKQLLVKDE